MSPAVTQELAHPKFFRQPYPSLLNNHIIYRRRRLNNRRLRLQPDRLHRYNNFCGTVEYPRQKNQSTSDLSHTILILNPFLVPSLARVENSNKQQLTVAQYSPTISFFRIPLPTFSFFIFSTRCLIVTNSTLTASGLLLNVDPTWELTVLLSKIYWSYSTHIVRVCFTPLLKPTLKRDLKCKKKFQINYNSPAMTNFYELLCYHSLEHLDAILDEFFTFTYSILSSLYSFPDVSTVLPKAIHDNIKDPRVLQCILHTNFGMCNPRTNKFFPSRGLVKT